MDHVKTTTVNYCIKELLVAIENLLGQIYLGIDKLISLVRILSEFNA